MYACRGVLILPRPERQGAYTSDAVPFSVGSCRPQVRRYQIPGYVGWLHLPQAVSVPCAQPNQNLIRQDDQRPSSSRAPCPPSLLKVPSPSAFAATPA